ncbi:SDR family oxidoreductase [Streptacidiphilus sp. MAP5-3]|uniref:SDR family oxidoreductase n=1 Tax=unclassified Streptacidiphilus TaxID=2643834 RepID=UPI003511FB8E
MEQPGPRARPGAPPAARGHRCGAGPARRVADLGRYAEASEIAATVAHLESTDGRYITGTTIAVDGGFTA